MSCFIPWISIRILSSNFSICPSSPDDIPTYLSPILPFVENNNNITLLHLFPAHPKGNSLPGAGLLAAGKKEPSQQANDLQDWTSQPAGGYLIQYPGEGPRVYFIGP